MLPHRYSSAAIVPPRYYNDKAMYRQKPPAYFNNNNMYTVNAIETQLRAAAVIAANQLSLYPHGESYPDISINDLEIQRRLWTKPVWTHKENPTWQPSSVKSNLDCKRLGTEMIQRKCEDKLTPCYNGLNNFYSNIQPASWQLASPIYRQSDTIATSSMVAVYDKSDKSDCSSVCSKEGEYDKLPELSFEFASNWDIDL